MILIPKIRVIGNKSGRLNVGRVKIYPEYD